MRNEDDDCHGDNDDILDEASSPKVFSELQWRFQTSLL